jgi:hypothetical protein
MSNKTPGVGAAFCRPLFTRITMHPVGARFIAPTDKNILLNIDFVYSLRLRHSPEPLGVEKPPPQRGKIIFGKK